MPPPAEILDVQGTPAKALAAASPLAKGRKDRFGNDADRLRGVYQ